MITLRVVVIPTQERNFRQINYVLSIAAIFGLEHLLYVYIFLTEFKNVYLTLSVLIFIRIFSYFPIAEMWLNCVEITGHSSQI